MHVTVKRFQVSLCVRAGHGEWKQLVVEVTIRHPELLRSYGIFGVTVPSQELALGLSLSWVDSDTVPILGQG